MDTEMDGPAKSERRLRVIARVVLYPVALAVIALAWHQRQAARADVAPLATVRWEGYTQQGNTVTAVTVGGRIVSFRERLSYRCGEAFGSALDPWPGLGRWRVVQHGDVVEGQAGPTAFPRRRGDPPGVIVHRLRLTLGEHPRGTLWGKVVINPPRAGRFTTTEYRSCRTGAVRFTLDRARQG
jgi:hypothetical protein